VSAPTEADMRRDLAAVYRAIGGDRAYGDTASAIRRALHAEARVRELEALLDSREDAIRNLKGWDAPG
jgi:hypothetical protein